MTYSVLLVLISDLVGFSTMVLAYVILIAFIIVPAITSPKTLEQVSSTDYLPYICQKVFTLVLLSSKPQDISPRRQ